MKKQSGVSLSEALISLFLSSLIMTSLMQFYLSSKRQYVAAEEILTTGFELQWVSDLLSDSIRRAGFTPCLGMDQLNIKDRRSGGEVIHGLKTESQPQQFIQVNRMNERFAKVVTVQSPTRIVVAPSVSFKENRHVVIADCDHAEVHQIFSVDGTLITLDNPLQFSYAASAYIGEFVQERWFIKNNALYYQSMQTEEVSPLIHSLKTQSQLTHGRQFLEVILGLAEGKTHKIMVAVRGS